MNISSVSLKNNSYIPQAANSKKFSILSGVKAATVGTLLLGQPAQASNIRGALQMNQTVNFNLTQLNSTEFKSTMFELATIIGKGLAKGAREEQQEYLDSKGPGCAIADRNGTCIEFGK